MNEPALREQLLAEMRRHLVDGQLPCTAAHTVAQFWDVSPRLVGELADEAEIRLSLCQLGVFGYGPKAEGLSKLVRAAQHVPPTMSGALEGAVGGRIACIRCWQNAAALGVERLAVAEVAEAQGVKIVQCQLGGF
ncbi:MAG: hypothetical protein GX605_08315 [Chloroflexi bacterium]|nr:hypothetical protein [Chloroflexota bacterium]